MRAGKNNTYAQIETLDELKEDGVCRKVDTNLFFPLGATGAYADQIKTAKDICHSCPIKSKCLKWALDTREEFGIWGGATEEERRHILRTRANQCRAAF